MRSAFGAVAAVFTAAILGGVTVKMGNAPWATVAPRVNPSGSPLVKWRRLDVSTGLTSRLRPLQVSTASGPRPRLPFAQ